MLEKITAYIEKHNMLEYRDKVIAGISGGADSVCLLCVLRKLREEKKFEIIVVHVNHQLRGVMALRDEEFVQELCRQWDIPCIVYRRDVGKEAMKRKLSVEEAGREVRRDAFRETMAKYHGTKIAVAHQMNDNAETLLFHLARGTGLRGAGGMQPVSGKVIRPLLCLERSEIEEFLSINDISYCQDETNDSDVYTRNRIRHHFIASLEQDINPKAVFHMNRTMEWLREVQAHLDQEAEYFWEKCVCKKNASWILMQDGMEEVPEILKPMLIGRVIGEAAGQKKDIAEVHVRAVHELLKKQVGRQIDLPYGIHADRIYEGIQFTKGKRIKQLVEPIDLLARSEIQTGEWIIRHDILDAGTPGIKLEEKPYTKYFSYDIIGKGVSIRTREPGDDIVIDDAGNTQKLKSYFINQKIPKDKRDEILLITSGQHVLWIVGYRISRAFRVHSDTRKILKIEVSKYVEEE